MQVAKVCSLIMLIIESAAVDVSERQKNPANTLLCFSLFQSAKHPAC